MNKLNLYIDITVAAQAENDKLARTGVFRVFDNILKELINDENINLSYYLTNKELIKCAHKYLLKIDKNVKLSAPIFKQFLYNSLYLLTNLKNKFSPVKILYYSIAVIYKIFYKLINLMCKNDEIIFNKDKNCDAFFSVYYDFPDKIKKNKKIKKILMIHDIIPILYPEYFENNNNHYIKQLVESIKPDYNIICVSNATKNDLIKYRPELSKNNISVAYPAASDLFKPLNDFDQLKKLKKQYGLPHDSEYFLTLCTFEPRKNLKTIIQAFINYIEITKNDNQYLVLAGSKGWGIDDILKNLTNFDKYKNKIIITGFVDDNLLPVFYSNCLSFIFASFYEGFGLPPLEAMKCGAPVIVSNQSSIPEVTEDAGIYIDPNSIDNLTDKMIYIYNNKYKINEFKQKSLEQSRKFSWNKTVMSLKNILK